MSILNKKNALTVALVAGLGLAGGVAAFTVTLSGAPIKVATADIANANTDIGINQPFVVSLNSSDTILGRTTGFTVRYTLDNGATFGDILDNADLSTGAGAPGWTASIAAGGGLSDGFVVINMNPPSPTTTLTTGPILNIAAANAVVNPTFGTPTGGGQILDSLTALQTAGARITATASFIDPVTGNAIGGTPAQSLAILESGNPVVLACNAADGDNVKRIDVGVTSQASKTFFASSGEIGGADSGYINLGTVGASVATGFTSFAYNGSDEFQTVLTGDFSAFSQSGASVFLSADGSCSLPQDSGTINNTSGTVTFNYTGADVGIGATGFSSFVCAEVPGGNTVVIDASSVSAVTTFTRGSVTANSGAACPLVPLRYNGSVVEVYHLNPAGNTQAQSFLRVINPGDTAGTVTIVGTDDNGADGAAAITFTLGAKRSMQVNSEDLENGNAAKGISGGFGDGAGKWRAVVTGEFAAMRVQSLNRNTTDGTVTNLTDVDGQGEQILHKLLDQGF